ncbi:MAG: TIGR02147 family protein, partial [Bdellovibrio sp.]
MKTPRPIFKFTNYRSFLRDVLSWMKERNPQFSLRALAKKLDTPPSFLSEVLSGKKSLSLDKALQIGRSLKMDVRETTFLCYLVVLESCTDPEQKENLLLELAAFSSNDHRKNVDLNIFEVIASWECIAVLELLTIYPH